MENFNILYKKNIDWDWNHLYDFYGIRKYDWQIDGPDTEQVYYFKQIDEFKSIVFADFKRILENKIMFLQNNDKLVQNIQILLETYGDVGTTEFADTHFMILSDDWLCFNNIEQEIDMSIYEYFECETIVIVNRSFSKYYFVKMCSNILNAETKTEIHIFNIVDNKIIFNNVKFDDRFEIKEYTDYGVQSAIKKIKKMLPCSMEVKYSDL